MYFQQSDILRGVDKNFVKEFMDIAEKETHKPGYTLFRHGDRASHFYVLLKGQVKLTIGEIGHTVYTVDRAWVRFSVGLALWGAITILHLPSAERQLRFSASIWESSTRSLKKTHLQG